MSYQGFNWSPYFDHMPDHPRRNQPSEINNESYQRHSYQPAATHIPSVTNPPSQEYPSAQSSAERNSSSHPARYAPGGESTRNVSQEYFDSRRLPPYSAAQTSINTSAMGSLVYASSLAQEQRTETTQPRYGPMQHIVDYNRYSQPPTTTSSSIPAVYGLTSTASNGYEQRSDSRGSGVVREEYRRPDSRNNYPTSNTNPNTNLNTELGNEKYNQFHAKPMSRDSSKAFQSSSTSRQSEPTSVTQSKRFPSAKQTKVVAPTSNSHVAQNRTAISKQTSYSLPHSLPYQSQKVQHRENPAHESLSSNNRDIAHSSQMTDAQNQTTVDPSHIFNHHEFQKRKTAAQTSRKVEEAATKVTKPPHVAVPAPAPAPAPKQVPTPAAAAASAGEDPADGRKNQMELEMMQMIEKMRDYKAKDPALFSQIWEQVKKVKILKSLVFCH